MANAKVLTVEDDAAIRQGIVGTKGSGLIVLYSLIEYA